jgi:hypothetical protein
MNYATLSQLIQDYLENNESTFVANIPNIVKLAEERIYRAVQLQFLQKNATSNFVTGNQYLTLPTDFWSPLELSVTDSGSQSFLFPKDVSFIRAAFPSASVQGRPRYYAMFDQNTFIVGPTPDNTYTTELHYIYKPESIVTSSTNWLGDNAENALLYGSLIEAYRYEKGDPDMFQTYNENYQEAIVRLKLMAEGQNRPPDAFKSPEPQIGRT